MAYSFAAGITEEARVTVANPKVAMSWDKATEKMVERGTLVKIIVFAKLLASCTVFLTHPKIVIGRFPRFYATCFSGKFANGDHRRRARAFGPIGVVCASSSDLRMVTAGEGRAHLGLSVSFSFGVTCQMRAPLHPMFCPDNRSDRR